MAKYTHDMFVNNLNEKNKNIEVKSRYINSKTKIEVRCKIDGYTWNATPSNLLSGQGCPNCSNRKRKTHEEFLIELSSIFSDIEVVGKYINTKNKVKLRCKIDGYEWEAYYGNIMKGKGCPKCYKKSITKTECKFINEIKELHKDIEVVGRYINNFTELEVKCKIDGHSWYVKPRNLLMGKGCPKCYGNIKKSNLEFIEELRHINDNIIAIDKYVNAHKKIKFKCCLDGHVWEAKPNNILQGQGCPICNSSKGENKISEILISMGIDFEKEYRPIWGRNKRYDFRLLKHNILIEFDGIQHFKDVSLKWTNGLNLTERIAIDNLKDSMAIGNRFSLIRISCSVLPKILDNLPNTLLKLIEDEKEVKIIYIGEEYAKRKSNFNAVSFQTGGCK